jgi:L-aminopeptidase/D-esterase-like protein
MQQKTSITDVPGIRVGHAQDFDALTGCTVVLCEQGAAGGVDQRGGAPGTRETDALHPMHLVEQVHAVVLSGGSAFGLDAASGAVRFLEEQGVGYETGFARVPIVPAAVLYDLGIGRADVRPDAAMGYQACLNASAGTVEEGTIGAGTGATVGKILGMGQALKSGIGTASIQLGALVVGALAAVNALGDIVDPLTGAVIAGARSFPGQQDPALGPFIGSLNVMRMMAGGPPAAPAASNTVIGVVATNARLNREQANKVAQMAQDGLARTVRPAHTMFDGDTIFALATGTAPENTTADVNVIGAFAAEVFAQAVVRAVLAARGAGGLPSASEL